MRGSLAKTLFFNPDVTKEMIRRSKAANLEVIIDPLGESLAAESINKVIENGPPRITSRFGVVPRITRRAASISR
jgi:hypothetical protein